MQTAHPFISQMRSPASQSTTRVILVRHGRSTFNDEGRYQGSSDVSVLTQMGWETAHRVGKALHGVAIDAIYASPLKRVDQTVSAIAAMLPQRNIPIHWTWQLREIDLPTWEGLPFQLVQEQFAEAYHCWKERPHKFQLPGAETGALETVPRFPVLDLYARARQFWHSVLPRHQGQTLLIVSHGGTNHALISTALGLSVVHHHSLQQSNCGVSVLEFAQGKVSQSTLRSLNLTHYLGETLPKLKEGKQGLRLLLVPAIAEMVDLAKLQPLAARLKTIPIHFSLSTTANLAQATIKTLCHQPATVHLQTSCPDFALWHQQIVGDRPTNSDLTTGLVVAHPTALQSLLAEAIALSRAPWRIALQPGSLSVLHYPSHKHRPILQTLNQGEWESGGVDE